MSKIPATCQNCPKGGETHVDSFPGHRLTDSFFISTEQLHAVKGDSQKLVIVDTFAEQLSAIPHLHWSSH